MSRIAFVSSDAPAEFAHWLATLTAAFPNDHIVAIASADDLREVDTRGIACAVVSAPPAGLLARFPDLRFVQSLWAGVDGLLADPALPAVPIARMVDPTMTQSMVVTVVAHVTSLHLGLHRLRVDQGARRWQYVDQPPSSATAVAIVGLGELGAACALALVGLGFNVTGWSRTARTVPGVRSISGPLHAALTSADIVVNLLPLTAETRGIFSADVLGAMRRGASFVNVGRGASVDHGALLELLDCGHLEHAVLDVFETEPLPVDDPRWANPKITITPHVAAVTTPASAARIAADNIGRFRATGTADHIVNPSRGY
jgi:glyoxylate/hydroxypyruvate reductase